MWDPWQDLQRIVDAVNDAPSIFNDRPWQFRVVAADRIELHANALVREEYISCGAALYNLRLAIRVAGHDHTVWLLPNPRTRPTLLASVEIMTGRLMHVPSGAEELYDAMLLRRTSREPFEVLRVPLPLLVEMENAAAAEQGWLRIVHPRQARHLLRASAHAGEILLDPDRWGRELFRRGTPEATREETRRRLAEFQAARGRVNAVPRDTTGPTGPTGPEPGQRALLNGARRTTPETSPTREDFQDSARPSEFFEPAGRSGWGRGVQLMTLSTDDDRPLDWLRAGQALQHALLTATRYSMSAEHGRTARYHATKARGLPARRFLPLGPRTEARYGVAVSPLTQMLELEDIKGEARHWPRTWYHRWPWWWYPEVPQMVLRVGYVPVEPRLASRDIMQPLVDERVQPPREWYPTNYRPANYRRRPPEPTVRPLGSRAAEGEGNPQPLS